MTDTISLSVRNTHRYVGSYADLDDWTHIGQATLLSKMETVDEEDICETTTITLHLDVSVDSDQDDETIKQALRDSFTHAGCAHDYDCCGCWSTYVQTITKTDTSWIVTQSASRNY